MPTGMWTTPLHQGLVSTLVYNTKYNVLKIRPETSPPTHTHTILRDNNLYAVNFAKHHYNLCFSLCIYPVLVAHADVFSNCLNNWLLFINHYDFFYDLFTICIMRKQANTRCTTNFSCILHFLVC
jgi:hypothetical protein